MCEFKTDFSAAIFPGEPIGKLFYLIKQMTFVYVVGGLCWQSHGESIQQLSAHCFGLLGKAVNIFLWWDGTPDEDGHCCQMAVTLCTFSQRRFKVVKALITNFKAHIIIFSSSFSLIAIVLALKHALSLVSTALWPMLQDRPNSGLLQHGPNFCLAWMFPII